MPPKSLGRLLSRVHPNLLLVGAFAAVIAAGTLLLRSPAALSGRPLSWIDALFTSTSAVCVTGLTVVDTGTRFSTAGQLILLLLIQVGGLGIMTYTTVVILLLGRRPSMQSRELLEGTFSYRRAGEVPALVRSIFRTTLLFETAGAALLFAGFARHMPPGRAAYQALFHSVSAFCNAGFSLFSSSLTVYATDPLVSGTVMVLIVCGGLGFVVLRELAAAGPALVGRRKVRLSLHCRTVLVTTACLILAGTAAFVFLEGANVLAGLSWPGRILVALFQAVTPRTAGFNTVDIGLLTNATLLVLLLLMFVGASPGSAGGGVKTTSFSVLLALAWAKWKAREETFLFRRTVPAETVARSISIILLSAFLILGCTLVLSITELRGVPHPGSRGLFLAYLFEAVSAFGTVGLSMGVTPTLSGAGKAVLILLMFLGRLGPITVAMAVSRRGGPAFTYPEENLMVG